MLSEKVKEYVNWKEFRNELKKSIIYLDPNKDTLYEFILKPTEDNIKMCLAKYPHHTFLNNMSMDAAYKIFMEHS